jgi:hypothetical protein
MASLAAASTTAKLDCTPSCLAATLIYDDDDDDVEFPLRKNGSRIEARGKKIGWRTAGDFH